ncbi:sialidase family protein [Falsirhodobacter deserti]|uniref:sialidase family protein n=1 Tax=Falsirhodobacter deserti TaxID=1365611 RepID=UPI000FE3EA39|nr:exo-alpha-sialidase [Falsirhodobacter deserti]
MTPQQIEAAMDGRIRPVSAARAEGFLPSPMIQNHAAFLTFLPDGALLCAWFGGTLEGKSDISIHASVLPAGADQWGPVRKLSHDPDHSEQNPVIFHAPEGDLWLFHTSQPSGNQDECRIRMTPLTRDADGVAAGQGRFLDLPRGCFVRGNMQIRDGAWELPIFRCVQRPGQKWTGSHDDAAIAISTDQGRTWRLEVLPQSTGNVHMSPVGDVAFFRRRQADHVARSEYADAGWTAPQPTDLPNNNSSIAATRLADGRIALICNLSSAASSDDRRASLYDELGEEDGRPDADPAGGCVPVWGVPRAPVAVCLSEDEGRTFPTRIVIEDGPGTCLSNDSTDGRNKEMSYPWLVEAPDGTLHIAYTYHRRAIKHVRLAPGWAASTTRQA